jgi:murein DD-endopeptidase MepM/ murein hydrolase activator NlpD
LSELRLKCRRLQRFFLATGGSPRGTVRRHGEPSTNLGDVTLATLWRPVGAAIATSRAATAGTPADEAASVSRVVPGGRLGVYRHGTYPSRGDRTHVGVDIVAPCGTLVRAPKAGTIIDQIRSPSDPDFESLGYMVIVEHPASLTGRVFYTLYLHLQSAPVRTEHVVQGAELGRVGETGRATGCHLHLEVRYFRDRVSALWQNIYGPGDQRHSRHFHENWEEPVTFLARLEHVT